MSRQYLDVIFAKVCEKDSQDAISARGISAFPTFHFYLNNQCLEKFSGADQNRMRTTVERLRPSLFAGTGATMGGKASTSADDVRAARLRALGAAATPASTSAAPTSESVLESSGPSNPVVHSGKAASTSSADPEALATLLAMGFSEAHVLRALDAVKGDSSLVEAAVSWLSEHQDSLAREDAEPATAEELAQLEAENAAAGGSGEGQLRKMTKEEMQAKIVAMRAQKAEENRRLAREQELRRREEGQKSIEVQDEIAALQRKREAEKIKQQKEFDIKERQRLQLEILKDKAEKQTGAAKEETMAKIKALTSGRPAASTLPPKEHLTKLVKALEYQRMGQIGRTAAMTLHKLFENLLKDPSNEKFRTIKASLPAIQERVLKAEGATQLLTTAGFHKEEADEVVYKFPQGGDLGLVKYVLDLIDQTHWQ